MELILKGSSVLKAWEAGVIPMLLKEPKLDYRKALEVAELWGCRLHASRVGNLIVNVGLYLAGDLLIGESGVTALSYHSIGTSATAPAAGNTTINNEVARKQFSTMDRSAAVCTLSVFYLASESNYSILEAGVFGDDATTTLDSGTLFSHYLETYDNSGGSPNDLTWDYEITIAVG